MWEEVGQSSFNYSKELGAYSYRKSQIFDNGWVELDDVISIQISRLAAFWSLFFQENGKKDWSLF